MRKKIGLGLMKDICLNKFSKCKPSFCSGFQALPADPGDEEESVPGGVGEDGQQGPSCLSLRTPA